MTTLMTTLFASSVAGHVAERFPQRGDQVLVHRVGGCAVDRAVERHGRLESEHPGRFVRERDHVVADARGAGPAGVEPEDRGPKFADRVVDVVDRAMQAVGSRVVPRQRCLEGEPDGEQPLDHGVVKIAGDALPFVAEGQGISCPGQFLVGCAALGDVAHDGDHQRSPTAVNRAQADLHRKLGARALPPPELEARSHGPRTRVPHVRRAVRSVRRLSGNGKEPVDRLADQLVARVLEELFGHGVHEHDRSGLVDDENPVRSGVDRAAEGGIGQRRTRSQLAVLFLGHACSRCAMPTDQWRRTEVPFASPRRVPPRPTIDR